MERGPQFTARTLHRSAADRSTQTSGFFVASFSSGGPRNLDVALGFDEGFESGERAQQLVVLPSPAVVGAHRRRASRMPDSQSTKVP